MFIKNIILISFLLITISHDTLTRQETQYFTREIKRWDFNSKSAEDWSVFSENMKKKILPFDVTPLKRNVFLGKFSNDRLSLNVGSLPQHDTLILLFDLYIIGTWDGVNQDFGPDMFICTIDGEKYIQTTFSNTTFNQHYPQRIIKGNFQNPPKSGAESINSLGFWWKSLPRYDGILDAVYSISLSIPHSSKDVSIVFEGNLRDSENSLYNESWGIDNVVLSTKSLCNNIVDFHYQRDSLLINDNSVIIIVDTPCDSCELSNGSKGKMFTIEDEGTYKIYCIKSNGCRISSKDFTIRRKYKIPQKGK